MKRIMYIMSLVVLLATCGKENGEGTNNDSSKGVNYSETTDFVLVDMGVSVKWANMNLGASASWEIGNYYQYSNESVSGDIPGGGTATMHIPTQAEWEEFYLACRKKNTAVNGVNGFLFTSKNNGNSIFIPAGGYQYTYPNLGYSDVGDHAHYWTSTFAFDNGSTVYYTFISTWIGMDTVGGTMGFSHHAIEFDRLPIRMVN